ncbi:MAG: ISL3 family transposase, partial [Chloroflexota bacterium]|nr:ISL3 family transposase [Chloroflexota bacterium]
MLANLLLPTEPGLHLAEVIGAASGITLVVATTAPQVSCPVCGVLSARRHSRYGRTLADAPWATMAVRLRLQARRFVCANAACPRRIFTERVSALAAPSARRTTRLTGLLQRLGLALGGEAGARLAAPLGLLTSPTTLLRLVRQVPDPAPPTPHIIGVDDFAFRKGHTYGTILADHETGRPLDLLPDRTGASLTAWLRAQPTIEVITRDRAEAYVQGATAGAPQATQVADRWHLLHNLSETLDEILTRLYPELCAALAGADPAPPAGDASPPAPGAAGPTA